MTFETTMHITRPSRGDAYLDWLQMLTGAGLITFMWAHMILVSSVLIGPNVMNSIAHFFEWTFMAQIGGPLIGLSFLLHFVLAARKMPFRLQELKTFVQHARMMHHTDTWLWLVQVITALIVLVLGSIHMWVVLTDLPITAAKSAARIQGGFWLGLYLVLLPLVELHVSIGFYRIGVKWGFIKTSGRATAKRAENILFFLFMTIGIITLIRFMTLSLQ